MHIPDYEKIYAIAVTIVTRSASERLTPVVFSNVFDASDHQWNFDIERAKQPKANTRDGRAATE